MNNQTLRLRKVFTVEFRTADIVVTCFLLVLSVFEMLFYSNVTGWQLLVFKNIVALLTLFGALWGIQNISSIKLRSVCRIVSYVIIISFIYNQMGKIIHILFPYWLDPWINGIESTVFGCYPTVWFQTIAKPWLTELMMFAYVIYGLLIPIIAFFCHQRGQERGLERYLTELGLTNMLCYLCYILFPVAGPSRALSTSYLGPLDGYFFTAVTEYLKANVHLAGGAFPSAHCAASTVMLKAAYRHHRKTSYVLFPLIILIYVSTVYGGFHYVTDVVAGIGVALFVLWTAPKLQTVLDHRILRCEFSWETTPSSDVAREIIPAREEHNVLLSERGM